MKILQICPRVPYPPHDGGAIAMYDVAAYLSAQGHEVTILAVNTPKHYQDPTVLKQIATVHAVYVNTTISASKAFRNLFKKVPYNIERFISKKFERKLVELLKENQYDIIQIEGTFVAYYVDVIRKHTNTPVVLRSHNLEYLIWQRLAINERNPLKQLYLRYLAEGVKKFEEDYCNKFDAIAAITEQDLGRFRDLGCKGRIEFIPAGVALDRFSINREIKPKARTIFFIGALNWLPNLEGLEWFLDNVWQEVSKELPDLELHIAGKASPQHLLDLKLPNVFVHGFVPSASDFMQHYGLMLVPLLSGGGMRIKIIEGMAMGKCILSTSVGAEGIHCHSGENIMIADEPDEWVNRIRQYYNGILYEDQIGENALSLARKVYDNKRIIQKFLTLYRSLL
ncbi:MAG: glycosyltransferase family 4 protein [Hymenobacteraceae bacterium]|nr:glycosyltransferase family 4 protein [Hymenobacteraceae bacterium]MDX5396202.1 glycosyltransferase family 4 protein [Hymenobacteraceae bacterium]MDX5512265.1 glycosyltransferase family 4 protein [Hymenobacteraceae bacterium]